MFGLLKLVKFVCLLILLQIMYLKHKNKVPKYAENMEYFIQLFKRNSLIKLLIKMKLI